MKKLSEIGQAMYGTRSFVESPDPEEFFGALFAWKQGHDTYAHQVHVLTPAERREFAERCFRAGVEAVLFAAMEARFSTEGSCNKFLDENGL